MAADEVVKSAGMAISRDIRQEGNISLRLIPAGTPEPEKTRLQKVLDLLAEAEQDRDRAADSYSDMVSAWSEAQGRLDLLYGLLGVTSLAAAAERITTLQSASQEAGQ